MCVKCYAQSTLQIGLTQKFRKKINFHKSFAVLIIALKRVSYIKILSV